MLKIATMNVRALEEDEVFDRFFAQLSPFRQEKLNRYRFRKDRLLSLGAGVLLDRLLQDLGLREHDMEYSLGENEKPFFSNAPELQFNLSHSDTQVLAALSDHPVGCDIEKIRPIDLKLAKRFFHEDEYAAIAAGNTEAERQRLFFRYWTLKESYMKCTGLGFRLPLDSFCIRLTQPPQVSSARREQVAFREYELPEFCAAVCSEGDASLPEPEQVNIECE